MIMIVDDSVAVLGIDFNNSMETSGFESSLELEGTVFGILYVCLWINMIIIVIVGVKIEQHREKSFQWTGLELAPVTTRGPTRFYHLSYDHKLNPLVWPQTLVRL